MLTKLSDDDAVGVQPCELHPDDLTAMRVERAGGALLRVLAARYGVSERTVRAAVRGVVVERPSRRAPSRRAPRSSGGEHYSTKIKDDELPALAAARADGVTLADLARRYDVTVTTLRAALLRWERRSCR